MQCMELWGGSAPTFREVQLTGLEATVFSQPHEAAASGGDVYYFTSCASGRLSRVLLADVSGHGESAAETADNLRHMMRRNVNVIRQSRLMAAVNREFTEANKLGRFATAVSLTYFLPTRSLTISLAGHPMPLLYRAETGKWQRMDCDADLKPAFPFGVSEDTTFTTAKITLQARDRLLIYSDAFSEAIADDGTPLMTEGLVELLNQLPCEQPTEVIPQLKTEIKRLNAENLATDDATSILLRPTPETVPWKQNLMAPFRLMGKVRDRSAAPSS